MHPSLARKGSIEPISLQRATWSATDLHWTGALARISWGLSHYHVSTRRGSPTQHLERDMSHEDTSCPPVREPRVCACGCASLEFPRARSLAASGDCLWTFHMAFVEVGRMEMDPRRAAKLSATVQANAGTFSHRGGWEHAEMSGLPFPASLDLVTQETLDSWVSGASAAGTSLGTDLTMQPQLNFSSILEFKMKLQCRWLGFIHSYS